MKYPKELPSSMEKIKECGIDPHSLIPKDVAKHFNIAIHAKPVAQKYNNILNKNIELYQPIDPNDKKLRKVRVPFPRWE